LAIEIHAIGHFVFVEIGEDRTVAIEDDGDGMVWGAHLEGTHSFRGKCVVFARIIGVGRERGNFELSSGSGVTAAEAFQIVSGKGAERVAQSFLGQGTAEVGVNARWSREWRLAGWMRGKRGDLSRGATRMTMPESTLRATLRRLRHG
jgi:hypothetical protein